MLTSLSLTNFKSWAHLPRMRLSPITGLFGTNSSGKSSVIQLLLLLKQTAASSDRNQPFNFGGRDDYVNMGDFLALVKDHDVERDVAFELGWTLEKPLAIKDSRHPGQPPVIEGKQMELCSVVGTASTDKNGKGKAPRPYCKRIQYNLDDVEFVLEETKDDRGKYELLSNGYAFTRNQGRAWPLPGPVKSFGFPDQVNAYYQNAGLLSDLELHFEQMLGGVYYLGPLRDYPRRDYRWSGGEPQDVGARGELAVDALLAGAERGADISPGYRRRRQTIEQRIAYWLQALDLIHSFRVHRISKDSNLYEVRVRQSAGSSEVLLPDVGFGVSQVLPVLVLCYYAPEGSTLLFEQPEIHLHPAVQSGLADVFIDVVHNRRMQVIVESHSEHMLNRLQRRIAEDGGNGRTGVGISHDKVSLFFCRNETGESTLQELDVDLYGHIRNWPEGFFGDPFRERAEMEKAAIARRTMGAGA